MKIFISGITGSLGTAVSEKALSDGHTVVGFSRDELKQQKFKKHKNLTLYLGDVRDKTRVIEATRECDLIYHFAALKHVDKLEENPEEAFKTNLTGTDNILHAQRVHNIPKVVLSSTDKAAYPINAYGVSKAAAERLVLRNPRNVVCRYGNVLASRGSVLPEFVRTLRLEQKVYVTDPNMTRFWIPMSDAADFVYAARNISMPGNQLKIPPMRASSLTVLAEAVAECLRVRSFTTQIIGVRLGEKTHECLRTAYEGEEIFSNTVTQFQWDELVDVIKPIVQRIVGGES